MRRQSVLQPLENTGSTRRVTLGAGTKLSSAPNGRRLSTISRPTAAPQASQQRRQSVMPTSKPPTTPGRKQTQPRREPPRRVSGWTGRIAVQDNRPLKSKQYQMEMIIGIVNYLESHGFSTQDGHPGQITPDDLKMPSTTTIHQIFEFLIKQIDERFSLDRLDMGLMVLKHLGYPYSITKTMVTTAPHTWPTLLGALSWLRELLEYCEILPDPVEGESFLGFIYGAYDLFLKKDDTELNARQEEFKQHYQNQVQEINMSLQGKSEYKKSLKAEIERLKKSDKRPQALAASIAVASEDVSKMQTFAKDLRKHIQLLDANYEQLVKEQEAKKKAVQDLTEKISTFVTQVESQEMKQLDIGRINMDRQNLTEHTKTIRDKRLQSEDRAWKKEIEASHTWERCVELVEEYSELCNQLRLTPANVKYAQGHDFALSIGTPQDPQLSTDVKQIVRPGLENLVKVLREKNLNLLETLLVFNTQVDQLVERTNELDFQRKQLEADNKKLDSHRLKQKEQLEEELTHYWTQFESIMKEVEETETGLQQQQAQSIAELKAEIEDFKAFNEQLQKRHTDYFTKVINTLHVVADYKERVQKELETFKQQLQSVLETTL